MSRWGTSGTFAYAPGDVLTGTLGVALVAQDMFEFPVETSIISDAVVYRTVSGERYEYSNWNKKSYTFNFTDLREVTRDELFTMVNSLPILTFSSPVDTLWGTFRMPLDSWTDEESSHERYNVSFTIEET